MQTRDINIISKYFFHNFRFSYIQSIQLQQKVCYATNYFASKSRKDFFIDFQINNNERNEQ